MIDRFYTRDEVELGREIIILYDEDASLPRPLIAQGRHFFFKKKEEKKKETFLIIIMFTLLATLDEHL